jgi:hypothetical protein
LSSVMCVYIKREIVCVCERERVRERGGREYIP